MSNEIFGFPQSLTGSELVTIHQEQNGQLAKCSMPLSQLATILGFNWASLPTTKPSVSGVAWNDGGVVSIS
jgi:hypothetical protein